MLLAAAIILVLIYRNLSGLNIAAGKNQVIYIPTGASFEQVMDTLGMRLEIKKVKVFTWLAEKKRYPSSIKPGRYVIDKNMTYNGLINLLRAGRQSPVKITFNNVRTLNDIAGKIGRHIEADSAKIMAFLSDEANYKADGFNRENIISVFIPNTYEVYWNTGPDGLYKRMLREYRLFWNSERLSKAEAKGS